MIIKSLQDSIKISLFSYAKTNNPLIDTVISTMLITGFSYLVNLLYGNDIALFFANFDVQDKIISMFYKKNTIILEGKRSAVVTQYNSQLTNSSSFTDSFKAVFHNIVHNIEKNDTIYEIKEFFVKDENDMSSSHNVNFDGYVISQTKRFWYDKNLQIYARTEITKQEMTGEKCKSPTMVDIITIELYSHVTPLETIQKMIQKTTDEYLDRVENSRANKQFIYSLYKSKFEDSRFECWREYTFESTRTFDNIFFEGKEEILKKIHFFLNNPGWYYEMGIPYTLGFGLHGPPGTGKTSFFKALANLTGRHLIILSLKLVKTKSQLDQFFFENRYTFKNRESSIGFDKKIIIMEDIDCLGEIVWRRENKNPVDASLLKKAAKKKSSVETAVQLFLDKNEEQNKAMETICKPTNDDEPITLDDILNLWDGIKETPGRILGISSNHYDKLDPALTRPGRIDIELKLDCASREVIEQMYKHFYKMNLSREEVEKIKDRKYTPAEISGFYILYKDEPNNFLEKLIK
jgi:hypothetical protein